MSRSRTLGIVFTCLAILLAFPLAALAFLPPNPLQALVDAADPGDTILVEPGTYEGYLQVNKTVTIEANGDGVVLVAPEGGDLMWITAPGVVLKGLVLDGGVSQMTAVGVGNAFNLEIRNCTFRNLQTGIWISDCEVMNVVVANNTFENVRDYGIDNRTADNTDPYFRCLAIGNRFTFDSGADSSSTAYYANSRKGNVALFNTFEDYAGHQAISTPASADFLNATGNYWGEGVDGSDIDDVCSESVLFVPWSFADAAGHADYQLVFSGGTPYIFDVGASEGIAISIEMITTQPPATAFPLALAAYGDESPCPTTVQDDNPGADSYTAYFILQDVESGLLPATLPPTYRLTAEFPKEAVGDEADLDDVAIYSYDNDAWVDITEEDGLTIEVDGDTVRLIIDDYGDPGPFAITAGNGDTSSSGCSSTGAASLGLLFLVPFGLLLRSKK